MSSSENLGKPKLPISGVSEQWESYKAIRDHMHTNGAVLFTDSAAESVKACCVDYVYDLLTPLLVKMRTTEGSPQPSVEPLREELSDLYKRYSKKVIESQIILDSWVVRKFLGFIKMKCRIRKPSTVPWWKRWEKSNHVYFTIGFSGCFFWTVFPFLYTNTCVNKWFRSPAYNVYQTLCPSVLRPKVEKFQQLCLLLDPSLEEGAIACDEQTYYLSHIWRMYKIWLGR